MSNSKFLPPAAPPRKGKPPHRPRRTRSHYLAWLFSEAARGHGYRTALQVLQVHLHHTLTTPRAASSAHTQNLSFSLLYHTPSACIIGTTSTNRICRLVYYTTRCTLFNGYTEGLGLPSLRRDVSPRTAIIRGIYISNVYHPPLSFTFFISHYWYRTGRRQIPLPRGPDCSRRYRVDRQRATPVGTEALFLQVERRLGRRA